MTDARSRLGSIRRFDRSLTIATSQIRCDDSVACVIAVGRCCCVGRAGMCRGRSRWSSPLRHTVLGCGALLKNTFCLGSGDSAWFGPHIGDLDNLPTPSRATTTPCTGCRRFLELDAGRSSHTICIPTISPRAMRSRLDGVTRVPVQHHHAHVVSAMAEHGLDGPVIGVGIRRHWIWHRRHDVGRRSASRDRFIIRTGRDVSNDSACPAASARSASHGGSALALVADAFGGELPPEVRHLFDYVATPRFAAVRKLLLSRRSCRRWRAASGGISTRSARSF